MRNRLEAVTEFKNAIGSDTPGLNWVVASLRHITGRFPAARIREAVKTL